MSYLCSDMNWKNYYVTAKGQQYILVGQYVIQNRQQYIHRLYQYTPELKTNYYNTYLKSYRIVQV